MLAQEFQVEWAGAREPQEGKGSRKVQEGPGNHRKAKGGLGRQGTPGGGQGRPREAKETQGPFFRLDKLRWASLVLPGPCFGSFLFRSELGNSVNGQQRVTVNQTSANLSSVQLTGFLLLLLLL